MDNAVNKKLEKRILDSEADRGYMVLVNGKAAFEDLRNTLVDGIIMQDQGLAAYYLRNYGRNYFLPVVSAAYGEVLGEEKDSERSAESRTFSRTMPSGRHSVPIVEVDTYRVMETALD